MVVVDDHNDMMKKLMQELFVLNLDFQMVEYYENLIKFVFDLILEIVVEVLLNDLLIMLKLKIHNVVEQLFDKLKNKRI